MISTVFITNFLLAVFFTKACVSRSRYKSGISIKPPVDTTTQRFGGGGENGIRQVHAVEVQSAISIFEKRLGVIAGNEKIEIFEMLQLLETISSAMPGKLPQRRELMAFAEFVDGSIECVSMLYVDKLICPWEADVILIAQSPRLDVDKTVSMLEFVKDLGLNNAILLNYESLKRWENVYIQCDKLNNRRKVNGGEHSIDLGRNAKEYAAANKARCVYADNFLVNQDMGPYWYLLPICHPQDQIVSTNMYIRQKLNSKSEFEISFEVPKTGVECGLRGTVGGFIMLTKKTASNVVPAATEEFLTGLAEALSSRLAHPPIHLLSVGGELLGL